VKMYDGTRKTKLACDALSRTPSVVTPAGKRTTDADDSLSQRTRLIVPFLILQAVSLVGDKMRNSRGGRLMWSTEALFWKTAEATHRS
jgi:hypothetical protein